MNREIKGLIVEIMVMVLFLLVAIPVCASASSKYQEVEDKLKVGDATSVDISNYGDIKKIRISSKNDDVGYIKLILKISKFSDEYFVYLDDVVYDIRTLDYTEDEDNYYINLGNYEIDKVREFAFQLKVKDKSYYDETITYSFLTEGMV